MALIKRSDKLAFYGVVGESETTYHRMKNFTSLSTSKNPKEFTRQYVDEAFEQTDVTGYSPSIAFGFDLDDSYKVHLDIAKIADEELIGTEAVRDIIIIDITKSGTSAGSKAAFKRSFAVIPDSEGDGTDAYTYSGNFKTKGSVIVGEAATKDEWQTITFTEKSATPEVQAVKMAAPVAETKAAK